MEISLYLDKSEPALRRIAARYSANDADLADDLFQSMVEHLIRRAAKDPAFLDQKPAYIFRAAQLVALQALRNTRRYFKYINPIDAGESDLVPSVSMIAAAGPDPESATEMAQTAFAVLDALRTLEPRDRKIATMLYEGFSPSEIAREVGISRQYFSQRRAVIANTVRRYL